MNTTPTPGPTDIELYLRETAVPTEYTLRERLVDYWAGRADRRHLSTNQVQPRTDEVIETVLLTPWAVARRNEYRASKDWETITHNRIVDPLRTEKATLQVRLSRLKEAVGIAREEADTAGEAARESAADRSRSGRPSRTRRTARRPAALAARRGREKQARTPPPRRRPRPLPLRPGPQRPSTPPPSNAWPRSASASPSPSPSSRTG